jgi:AraC-like DNA-binding protein
MFYQVLVTIGAAQALNLAILAWLKPRRSQSDLLLGLNLFLMFLIIILFNYRKELTEVSHYFALHAISLGYLAVTVFYWYIKSMIRGRLDFSRPAEWVHILPFLAAVALWAIRFVPMAPEAQAEMLRHLETGYTCPTWFYVFNYGLFLGVFPFYLIKSFHLLKEHESYILTKFSYTEDVSLSWMTRFLWGMVAVWLGFFFFEIVANDLLGVISELWGFRLAFLCMIANIFLLGLYGIRQGAIFSHAAENGSDEEPAGKYAYSSLTEAQAEDYRRQLLDYMRTAKPYLEPRITIGELAQRLDVPANELSRVINEQLGQNFFDFINGYRVAEFKNLLAEPANRHLTLLSLAHEAGFNSKSSFNAIFKKSTGLTPSEYARQLTVQPAG